MGSFQFSARKISVWKSTGIFNYLGNSNMNAGGDSKGILSDLFTLAVIIFNKIK